MLRLVLFDGIYLTAAVLLAPVWIVLVLMRKKWRTHFWARFGAGPRREGTRPCVWFHAVSVGEVMAAKPLIAACKQAYPQVDLVLTTTTATGRKVADEQVPGLAMPPQQCPHDLSFAVHRFLKRVRPSLAVMMELEVWPNAAQWCRRKRIPMVVANGRLTAKSSRGYRRAGWLLRPMFASLARVFAQTPAIRDRFVQVGVSPERVEVVGSIKYDGIDVRGAQEQARTLRTLLNIQEDDLVWVAGSTHPPEHETVVAAWQALRKEGFPLRLVLVPRHPERYGVVLDYLSRAGIPDMRMSEATARNTAFQAVPGGNAPEPGHDSERNRHGLEARVTTDADTVIFVDVMGKLASLYALADVAFVGGSLIPHGGQSVIEPAAHGVLCVTGPHTWNFAAPVDDLRHADAIRIIPDAAALLPTMRDLLADRPALKTLGANAAQVVEQRKGVAAHTVQGLAPWLPAQSEPQV